MLRSKLRLKVVLLLSVSPVAGAAGCDGGLPHPPYVPQATSALAPIDLPPPPGRVETIPKKPPGATAWVDGEWVHRHGRWYWLLGRWVRTPPGAKYSPWVFVRSSDGTSFYAPSTWKDAKGVPLPQPPPALDYATASGEAVFSAEGVREQTGRAIKTPPAHVPIHEPDGGLSDTSTLDGGPPGASTTESDGVDAGPDGPELSPAERKTASVGARPATDAGPPNESEKPLQGDAAGP